MALSNDPDKRRRQLANLGKSNPKLAARLAAEASGSAGTGSGSREREPADSGSSGGQREVIRAKPKPKPKPKPRERDGRRADEPGEPGGERRGGGGFLSGLFDL